MFKMGCKDGHQNERGNQTQKMQICRPSWNQKDPKPHVSRAKINIKDLLCSLNFTNFKIEKHSPFLFDIYDSEEIKI